MISNKKELYKNGADWFKMLQSDGIWRLAVVEGGGENVRIDIEHSLLFIYYHLYGRDLNRAIFEVWEQTTNLAKLKLEVLAIAWRERNIYNKDEDDE